ncbi:MAG TPA: hypothetical protein VEY07_05730 [Thermoplasmata archaeon]|nr:hypothetical protein [Thermoplasmata archaeon]
MNRTGVLKGLLESSDPSVRWRARVHVLDEDRDSRRIRRLEDEIRSSPRSKSLLQSRERLTSTHAGWAVYDKWRGIHWALLSLADIGYPRGEPALFPLRDRSYALWLGSHYFTEFESRSKAEAYRNRGRRGVPLVNGRYRRCASQQAGSLYATTLLGLNNARTPQLVERLLHWEWPDGGWNCDITPSADTSSFAETLLATRALTEYGKQFRNSAATEAARKASEVFLRRRLFRRVSNGRIMQPDFTKLHFPRYWHYDVLGGLTAMARLGRAKDPRCSEALDLLESLELPGGGWGAQAKYYSTVSRSTSTRMAERVHWGGTGRRLNPWVTTEALAALRSSRRWDP